MPEATIIEEQDDYLYAEFRSRIFRFVDDVEFAVDNENNEVHFRSASRVGHSDLGVNRARMERIQREFSQINTSELSDQVVSGDSSNPPTPDDHP